VLYHIAVPFEITIPFYFLHTSTGQTPGPMLMVDGSNDASWPKEVPFGYADAKKILLLLAYG